jgi:formate dehydrogenase maturation protein FdhE
MATDSASKETKKLVFKLQALAQKCPPEAKTMIEQLEAATKKEREAWEQEVLKAELEQPVSNDTRIHELEAELARSKADVARLQARLPGSMNTRAIGLKVRRKQAFPATSTNMFAQRTT